MTYESILITEYDISLRINFFDVSMIIKDAHMCVIGNGDERYTFYDILMTKYNNLKHKTIMIKNKTKKMEESKKWIILNNYDRSFVNHVIKTQNELRRLYKNTDIKLSDPYNNSIEYHDYNTFILIDSSVICDVKISNDDVMNKLFFGGRQHKMSFLVNVDKLFKICPEVRLNLDYIFLLPCVGDDVLTHIYNSHLERLHNEFDELCKQYSNEKINGLSLFICYIRSLTKNKQIVVVCMRNSSIFLLQ
jgi:hypothetical protein